MKRLHSAATLATFATTAMLLATTASAQATRTWVSGTGDDANPCSRTAPCKTYAGAISKTAPAGEINCIDPGGFGALTITKSLTIDCEGVSNGGVLVAGTNGININAGVNDIVILKGLDINGINGSGSTAGLNGIKISTAANVIIDHCYVYQFGGAGSDGSGILIANATSGVHVSIVDSIIANNLNTGILIKPGGGASARVSITTSNISNNAGDGVMANATATSGSIKTTISSTESSHNINGSGFAVFSAGADDEMMIDQSSASDNTNGVAANGSGAIARFTRMNISGNSTGVKQVNGGSSLSYGTSSIDANGVNGTFGAAAQQ
jgi:hypothetical protein